MCDRRPVILMTNVFHSPLYYARPSQWPSHAQIIDPYSPDYSLCFLSHRPPSILAWLLPSPGVAHLFSCSCPPLRVKAASYSLFCKPRRPVGGRELGEAEWCSLSLGLAVFAEMFLAPQKREIWVHSPQAIEYVTSNFSYPVLQLSSDKALSSQSPSVSL